MIPGFGQGWAEGLSVTGAGQPVSQINDRCLPIYREKQNPAYRQAAFFEDSTLTINTGPRDH